MPYLACATSVAPYTVARLCEQIAVLLHTTSEAAG
jgi:hypothetical protein